MAFDMKNRLDNLRQKRGSGVYDESPDDTPLKGEDEEELVGGFLTNVDEFTKSINQIGTAVEQLRRDHGRMLAAVHDDEAKKDADKMMDMVTKLSQKVHRGLNTMKDQVASDERGPERNTADFRIKKAQYTTLARKFRDVMGEYNNIQEEYREKCKERIQRQLKYTGRQVTEDQVEEMIESNNTAIFTQDILIDTAQKRQALNEVEERHKEILSLEQNIKELHEMFVDLAVLVDEQGEIIDRIEYNVETAAVHVDQGRKQLRQAVTLKRKSNRLRMCIICIVICVVNTTSNLWIKPICAQI
ncbi:hypothetical protein EMCRGX_G024148 [Ephydatia muelleri]